MKGTNLAVVISSCDLYSDCWKPLFHSIHKYWPDCPYPIYLICNYKDSGDDSVIPIKVGEHLGWGSNTKHALDKIDADYILLIQEDYFMVRTMSSQAIEQHIAFCERNDVDYIRLEQPYRDSYSCPDNDNYCYDSLSLRYALCLQPAIWRKDVLHRLAIEGWTGWDYEAKIRSFVQKNDIRVNSYVIRSSLKLSLGYPIVNGTGIRKGIWTRAGYKFLEENGFYDEMKGRKVEGKFMSWCMHQHHPLLRIPCAIIIRIMQKIMK